MIRNPRFWLVAQMVAVVVLAAALGLLNLRTAYDSASYLETAQGSPRQMLSSIRTAGYPLLLKTVARFSPDYHIIPWVQLGWHLLAVLLFDVAIRRFGALPWQALAASSGLLYTVLNDSAVATLITDSLGRSMAIMTVAMLFWVSIRPRLLPWIGLLIALACAYHVRPAYLFLLPLVPCLGLVLLRIRCAWVCEPFRWLRHAVWLCGVSFLPYLSFCLLRLVVVGHFGLVSFAGANLIGITVELLDRDTIENRLPDYWRPFAQELLSQREHVGQPSPFKDKGIDIYQWQRNYGTNCWEVGYATAARVYGNDPVVINEKLSGISKALLLADKGMYLRFVVYNLRDGVGRVISRGWFLPTLGVLALAAFFLRVMIAPAKQPGQIVVPDMSNRTIMHALILVAAMFAAAKLLLVSMVEVHVPRYTFAARMFLAAVFSLVICQELVRLATTRNAGSDREDTS